MDKLEDFVMVVCAPRGSGKTHLIRELVRHKFKHFDHIIIMCPSIDFNTDYKDYKKNDEWFEDDDRVVLIADVKKSDIQDVFDQQSAVKRTVMAAKKRRREGDLTADPGECPLTLLILDDCIDSGVISRGTLIDRVAERGRHFNLSVIICSQRISAVSRSIRINSDYFLIFSPFSIAEMEQFLEQFVSRSDRKQLRLKLQQIFAVKYQFIILDNTKQGLHRLYESNANEFIKDKKEKINFEEVELYA